MRLTLDPAESKLRREAMDALTAKYGKTWPDVALREWQEFIRSRPTIAPAVATGKLF